MFHLIVSDGLQVKDTPRPLTKMYNKTIKCSYATNNAVCVAGRGMSGHRESRGRHIRVPGRASQHIPGEVSLIPSPRC